MPDEPVALVPDVVPVALVVPDVVPDVVPVVVSVVAVTGVVVPVLGAIGIWTPPLVTANLYLVKLDENWCRMIGWLVVDILTPCWTPLKL